MYLKNLGQLAMLIGILSLQTQIWYSKDGLANLINLKRQQQETMQKIDQLRQLNHVLASEIIGLKQNKALQETYVRYKTGAIKSGETFVFIDETPR